MTWEARRRTEGNIDYWKCPACGLLNDAHLEMARTQRVYKKLKCKKCGATSKVESVPSWFYNATVLPL